MIADARPKAWRARCGASSSPTPWERIHAALYKKMLENLGKTPDADYWVCQVCRMTVEGEAPDECPVCRAKKQAFRRWTERTGIRLEATGFRKENRSPFVGDEDFQLTWNVQCG